MLKKIMFSLLGVLILAVIAAVVLIIKPNFNEVKQLSLSDAKVVLDSALSNKDDWTEQKIVNSEVFISRLPADQQFYLATQLYVVKQEVYEKQIAQLKSKLNTSNVGDNFHELSYYGVSPPLDISNKIFITPRPEIVRFVNDQPNASTLMPVAVAAQQVLTDGDWQPTLTALKSCKDWQCKVVLDMTFNTKERLIASIRAMKAGIYE
jgi:hypothetical protein